MGESKDKQKTIEEYKRELRESKARFQNIIGRSTDGILIVDMEGRVRFANPVAGTIFGCAAEALIGEDFGFPVVAGEKVEVDLIGRAGELVTADMRVTETRWDGEPCYLVSLRDITERKRMEDNLRLKDAAIATSINAIAMFDLEGHLTYTNASFLELWGYDSREEMLKQPATEFWLQPERVTAAIEALGEQGHWRGKLVAQRRDGSFFPVQAAISMVTRNGNEPIAVMASFLDITERQRMEEELRESEERFRSIVEQSQDGIVLVNPDGRIVEWNKGQEQIMGITREDALGDFLWNVQYRVALDEVKDVPGLRHRLKQLISKYLDDEQNSWPSNLSEREIKRPDGTHRIIQSSVFPIQTWEGRMVSSITRDITAQRRMEEKLQKLSRAVEQSPSAVVITDTTGAIEYVNPKFTEITGYSLQEVIGRNPRILKSSRHQSPEFYEELWDTITAGQEWRGTFCNRKKNGEIYWENASISPVRDSSGATTHYLKVAEDITIRREIEKALRQSEQRYRTLFEHAGDAIFVHNLEGQFLDVNRIACQLLGYSKEELLQMTPKDIATPEDAAGTMERIEQLQETEHIVFEATQVKRDGTPFPVEVSSRYIEYEGKPAILSIVRDISERKEAEEQIARYAADLERSNQELEQFASIVSHDLREPARMVKSYMELLERRYRDELDEKANMFIDYAVDGAKRMQEMISALLDLSRVETRGGDFAPVEVDAVVERTLRALGSVIQESGAEVTYDRLPTVMADQAQLAQVFQNLIANGIKFRRDDEPPRVHISAEQGGEEWKFSVMDNGIGIDEEQAERIFKIFQRLHTEDEYPGLGIGLALCKRIVERHGGRIWAESEPGKGSTFNFTIPTQNAVTL